MASFSSEHKYKASVASLLGVFSHRHMEDKILEEIKDKFFIDVNCQEMLDIKLAVEKVLLNYCKAFDTLDLPFRIKKLVPGGSVPENARLWDFQWLSLNQQLCPFPFVEFDYLAVMSASGMSLPNNGCCPGFKQVSDKKIRQFDKLFDVYHKEEPDLLKPQEILSHFVSCISQIGLKWRSTQGECLLPNACTAEKIAFSSDFKETKFDKYWRNYISNLSIEPFQGKIDTPSGSLLLNLREPLEKCTLEFIWISRVEQLQPPRDIVYGFSGFKNFDVHVDFLPVFEFFEKDGVSSFGQEHDEDNVKTAAAACNKLDHEDSDGTDVLDSAKAINDTSTCLVNYTDRNELNNKKLLKIGDVDRHHNSQNLKSNEPRDLIGVRFLVPKECLGSDRCCWKISTLLEEQSMIKKASDAHLEAYKLMKFFVNALMVRKQSFVKPTSYMTKAMFLYHLQDNKCTPSGGSAKECLHSMLSNMSIMYKNECLPNFFNKLDLLNNHYSHFFGQFKDFSEDKKKIGEAIANVELALRHSGGGFFNGDCSVRSVITCISVLSKEF